MLPPITYLLFVFPPAKTFVLAKDSPTTLSNNKLKLKGFYKSNHISAPDICNIKIDNMSPP